MHIFLDSALEESEWSASRPDNFTPGERAHDTHWVVRCVGPKTGLDVVAKRKNHCVCRESNPAHTNSKRIRYTTSSNYLLLSRK
jgi:hypothetical protein